jgi:quercetin dioxygenase-like cupin family protein
MPTVIPLADLSSSPTAWRFDGGPRAGVEVSFFVVHTPPGKGPGLHVHPYPEIFIVEEGEPTFTVGDEKLVVPAGNVLVVPAETPHGFKNWTDSDLRIVSIHPNPEVVQTWLEDD